MNLQQQLRLQLFPFKPAIDIDHRSLDDIGRRALNHRVDRDPLRQVSLPLIAERRRVANTRDRPAAAGDRADVAAFAALAQRLEQERIDAWVTGEIAVDEEAGVLLVDPQALG